MVLRHFVMVCNRLELYLCYCMCVWVCWLTFEFISHYICTTHTHTKAHLKMADKVFSTGTALCRVFKLKNSSSHNLWIFVNGVFLCSIQLTAFTRVTCTACGPFLTCGCSRVPRKNCKIVLFFTCTARSLFIYWLLIHHYHGTVPTLVSAWTVVFRGFHSYLHQMLRRKAITCFSELGNTAFWVQHSGG